VGVVALAGAELGWVALWLLVSSAHSELLSAAFEVAYGAHLLPLIAGAAVSAPLVRSGDRRGWVHLLTVVAAADFASLVLGLCVAVWVPGWLWRSAVLLALCAWLAVAAWSVIFVRRISASRTALPSRPVDAVVVLGCGLVGRWPGPMLCRRLDRAIQLSSPDVPVVVSGGQGADELASEGQVMADYLHSTHGEHLRRHRNQVLVEDRATNTRENLRHSLEILREYGLAIREVAVVTSDFHVQRTEMTTDVVAGLDRENGGNVRFSVFGAYTPPVARPAAYVREFVAYVLWTLRGLKS